MTPPHVTPRTTSQHTSVPRHVHPFCVPSRQPEHLLNTSDVTVQCHQAPSVIIRTVAAEEISASVSQEGLAEASGMQSAELVDPPEVFPDEIHPPKPAAEEQVAYGKDSALYKSGGGHGTELAGKTKEGDSGTDPKREEDDSPSDPPGTYVSQVRGVAHRGTLRADPSACRSHRVTSSDVYRQSSRRPCFGAGSGPRDG